MPSSATPRAPAPRCCSRPGADWLRPSFGAGSAARHALDGAVEIDASDLPTLRADVDLPGDLRTAAALGLGAATAGLLGAAAGPGGPGGPAHGR